MKMSMSQQFREKWREALKERLALGKTQIQNLKSAFHFQIANNASSCKLSRRRLHHHQRCSILHIPAKKPPFFNGEGRRPRRRRNLMFLYVCVFVEVLFEYNFQACDMGVGTGDCNIVVTIYMERFGTRMGDPKYLVLLLSITLLVWYTNIYHVRQFTRAILFLCIVSMNEIVWMATT